MGIDKDISGHTAVTTKTADTGKQWAIHDNTTAHIQPAVTATATDTLSQHPGTLITDCRHPVTVNRCRNITCITAAAAETTNTGDQTSCPTDRRIGNRQTTTDINTTISSTAAKTLSDNTMGTVRHCPEIVSGQRHGYTIDDHIRYCCCFVFAKSRCQDIA